jgi:hypothetical protein
VGLNSAPAVGPPNLGKRLKFGKEVFRKKGQIWARSVKNKIKFGEVLGESVLIPGKSCPKFGPQSILGTSGIKFSPMPMCPPEGLQG